MPIDLSSLAALGPYAGWALAVVVMAGVVTLIVKGGLVPGKTHDRALKREDALDARMDGLASTLHDQNKNIEFLVTFVQDTIRERRA